MAWPKEIGQSPSEKFSPVCSVKEKIPKIIWSQIWHDQKNLVLRFPLQKNSKSTVFCKWKNSEKFFTTNLAGPKKVGAQTPPVKNSEYRTLCKLINSKKILTSNLEWPNKLDTWTPPVKNLKSRTLCKQKNSEKYLTSNLAWPKKVGAHTSLPRKIQSPENYVKENNLKSFWTQIWHDQKKLVPGHHLWKILTPEYSLNEKIQKNFLV